MPRRGLAWLSALPLMAAGSVVAHALAYRVAEPEAEARADLLHSTGHGYLALLPAFLGACLALLLAALAGHALRAAGGRAGAAAAWPVALLPPVAFALQEHLERAVAQGGFPVGAALEPTFLVGLALQLPFGLLALLAARSLAGAAEAVGRGLAARPPAPGVRRPPSAALAVDTLLAPRGALALGRAGRGPPS